MRRLHTVLLLIFALSAVLLAQSSRGPSTAEERQRAVTLANSMESNPLGADKMDEMLKLQAAGTLGEYVTKEWKKSCK